MTPYTISFAGAGRVAGSLCREMYRSGIKILQVVSESKDNGGILAHECHASWSRDLSFSDQNDAVIVSVPDHRLSDVLHSLRCGDGCLVAHTAGSYGLEVFPPSLKNRGVFYPLQTFSKGRVVSFRQLPVLAESSDEGCKKILDDLAEAVGAEVHYIDNEKRKIIHLAAVFINNFTNYMLTSGSEIASKAGLSLSIFEPLLKETIDKALENGPERSQTGPAVRNDMNTVKLHLDLLSFSPELQNLYRQITDSIIKRYNKHSE
jgi:predicted short-subunit dehydrogenase-like oxidoreductase (DUF2520 family)